MAVLFLFEVLRSGTWTAPSFATKRASLARRVYANALGLLQPRQPRRAGGRSPQPRPAAAQQQPLAAGGGSGLGATAISPKGGPPWDPGANSRFCYETHFPPWAQMAAKAHGGAFPMRVPFFAFFMFNDLRLTPVLCKSEFRNLDQNSASWEVEILVTSLRVPPVCGFLDQNLGQNPCHVSPELSKLQDLGYILYRKLES